MKTQSVCLPCRSYGSAPRRAAPWWGLLPGATKVVAARPSASPARNNGQFMPSHMADHMPNHGLSSLVMANQLIRFETSVCDCVSLEKDIHQFTAILFCPVPTNREAAGAMGKKVRATIV